MSTLRHIWLHCKGARADLVPIGVILSVVCASVARMMTDIEDYGRRFGQAVAAELRAARGRKDITLEALAEMVGLSRSAATNYLKGRREIPMSTFLALCRALDVSPREVFQAAQDAVEQ